MLLRSEEETWTGPCSTFRSMDALSVILDSIELRGSLYFPTHFRSPWGLRVPADSNVCRFHVAVEGGCFLGAGGEQVWLSRGDLALVPHGREHFLLDAPDTPAVPLEEALEVEAYPGTGVFSWGAGGESCRLVCGYFGFDKETAHPLLEALPAIVHVKATPTYDFRWIDQVMQFIGEETRSQRPGSQVISRRLSEVLFVQVIRHYAESAPSPVPVLAGITDPRLSRALYAIHASPETRWTLQGLAEAAGMSRTAFSQRFAELIGVTPMRYLTTHRMHEARNLLRAGQSVGAIADQVGYNSEAAFARKFKQAHGVGPGQYRKASLREASQ